MKLHNFFSAIILSILTATSFTISARQPERGYRGMIDWSNELNLNFGFLVGDPGDSDIMSGFTTTHGYQFNSWLFAGGGAGFEANLSWHDGLRTDMPRFIIPVYAEGRLDGRWGRFTPFLSIKLGANLANHGGVYFSPTIGYRFNWGRKTAINLGLGMTLSGRRMSYHEHVPAPDGGLTYGDLIHYQGHDAMFTARLGFEF